MFKDIQFPTAIAQGAEGGPTFNTVVDAASSGREQRAGLWLNARWEFDVTHALKRPSEMFAIKKLFLIVNGMQHSFRFKDWGDYTEKDTETGLSVGMLTPSPYSGSGTLQMYKAYTLGGDTYMRKITKPVSGTITIKDGSGNTLVIGGSGGNGVAIDYTSGVATLHTPGNYTGQAMVWFGQFDNHARLGTDKMRFKLNASTIHSWEDIPIIEIKE